MDRLKRVWGGATHALKILADSADRQAWIRVHRKDLRGLQGKEPTPPLVRPEPKIGRNDLYPCGSGKKYKKCWGDSS